MLTSRRRLLGGIAAGSVAATSLTAVSAHNGIEQDHYDVVVIGGGFAGLVAARNCAQQGRRVLLLEARDRIGGRTHDVDFEGHPIELGGTWIHWTQGYVWEEFSRYGLTLGETPDSLSGKASWISGNKLHEGEATEFVDKMLQGLQAFFAGGDLAKGWRGFIDGAIETGVAAAQRVSQQLQQKAARA